MINTRRTGRSFEEGRTDERKKTNADCHRSAFTLIELLLVLSIMGVLMAMVVPNLLGRQEHANIDITRGSIAGIEQALQMYQLDHQGAYPSSREGLQSLVQRPGKNDKRWRGPYLQKLPFDAWGNPFIYISPGKRNTGGYDIVSMGADRRQGTDDDIGNWE